MIVETISSTPKSDLSHFFEDSGIYSSKYTTQGKEELHSISLCADANLAFLSNKPIKYFWEHLTGPQMGKMQ